MKALKIWLSSLKTRFQKTGKQFKENLIDDLEITDFDHHPIYSLLENQK